MTIRYLDGTSQVFEMPEQWSEAVRWERWREVIDLGQLLIDTGQSIVIVPLSAVRNIEIEPPLESPPKLTLRGARLVGEGE